MKFLVDAMLGKLVRFLRIFGYDTVYADDLEEFFNMSPVSDDKLKEYAQKENRIIITKDLPFYNKIRFKAVYLKGEGVYNYLNQLKLKLNLEYKFQIHRARCSVCNSVLEKVQDKNSIKEEVPVQTYENYDDFYQCSKPECGKIYWNGPHITDILTKIKKKQKKN
ncbi:MAG: hypothetical protein EU516_00805 [Promethearchaeota archaeon]|nr:MAG: hypothetical protein EU516_00805 [Candidatus Lokiarchaeota archaeon]